MENTVRNGVSLEFDLLVFRFPEIHRLAECQVTFVRTLRIPDDDREYPLPPGLGSFPVSHVADYAHRLPPRWKERGGVFFPMYQAEAMWLSFKASYPFAMKIAAGKINAVTGEEWKPGLTRDPQNYLALWDQPWLDGFCVDKGRIRQFVAMPLGEGYTAEEQFTGAAEHGGLQIVVCPMGRAHYERIKPVKPATTELWFSGESSGTGGAMDPIPEMGLAPGGVMKQEVYEDRYGIEVWDTSVHARCSVHLLNAVQYRGVTGKPPPTRPPTAADYAEKGLPWFDYYAADLTALRGSSRLAGLMSVFTKAVKSGDRSLPGNAPVTPGEVISLGSSAQGSHEDERP